jgi:hypothetical protein
VTSIVAASYFYKKTFGSFAIVLENGAHLRKYFESLPYTYIKNTSCMRLYQVFFILFSHFLYWAFGTTSLNYGVESFQWIECRRNHEQVMTSRGPS